MAFIDFNTIVLFRMDEEVESEEDDDYTSEDEEKESADSDDNDARLSEQTYEVKKRTLKRRVSFKEESDSCNYEKVTESDETDCDMIRIAFKHSDTPLCVSSDASDDIVCPSDIYLKYLSHRMPKSILKPSHSVDMLSEGRDTSTNDKAEVIQQYLEPAIKVSIIL